MSIDKRSFFRVDDRLKLSWRRVENSDSPSAAELDVEVREINEKLNNLIALAFQESAVVGEAMGLINRKLDLLTVASGEAHVPMAEMRVNLSGAGIGFASETPAQVDDFIDITMILKPSNVSLTLRAEVIGSEASNRSDEKFWIRAAFEEGQDIAAEQIIQHVNYRQMQFLAAKHHQEELDEAMWEYVDEDEDEA